MRDLNSPPNFYSKTKDWFFSVLPIIYTKSSLVYLIDWGNSFVMKLSIIFAVKFFVQRLEKLQFYSITPTIFLSVVTTILLSHYFTGSPAVILPTQFLSAELPYPYYWIHIMISPLWHYHYYANQRDGQGLCFCSSTVSPLVLLSHYQLDLIFE